MGTLGMHALQSEFSRMLHFAANRLIILKAILSVEGKVRPAIEFLYLTLPVPYQQYYIAENSGKASVCSFKQLFIPSIDV